VFENGGREQAIKQWHKARVATIREKVSAADVLTRHGVTLRKHGGQQEQISCPFHGKDNHPSARYYPDTGESPSGVYCWVCRERWDAIELWKRFNGEEKFSRTLFNIERAFGLTTPEFTFDSELEDEYDPLKEEVYRLFDTCENNLREYKRYFDMQGHLRLGSILDQIRFQVEHGALPFPQAQERLNLILAKIGQKVRATTPDATDK
jgi:hypothetical protein